LRNSSFGAPKVESNLARGNTFHKIETMKQGGAGEGPINLPKLV